MLAASAVPITAMLAATATPAAAEASSRERFFLNRDMAGKPFRTGEDDRGSASMDGGSAFPETARRDHFPHPGITVRPAPEIRSAGSVMCSAAAESPPASQKAS
ncbi:hypothetical protein Apa02nite_035210 [Actinoplanes palleronii]|uniref:Uncharacterized protein n=1 Tax=Actinoplanes palleronii TaxID=113570 RepID=A0ABQ4B9U5_9ACTN|nr:hypothetical protein Apa02nite_035210 [Actinoplanes palleronii]